MQRPCWYPFVLSAVKLKVSVNDEQGGKLSLKNEEELLRTQRGRCAGCGEPLISTFFGLEKNFQPCRYHGGLFCRRWCHSNEHRVIPHRLLNFWDAVAHRVSRQSAAFLDDVWRHPVLHLSSINPLLYEGLPALRAVRGMRGQLARLLRESLSEDAVAGGAPRAREAVASLAWLGEQRLYMCVSEELYSLADLLEVQSGGGDLVPALSALVDALRRGARPGTGTSSPLPAASRSPLASFMGLGRR